MPRESTGTVFRSPTGAWCIRVTIAKGERRAETLGWCKSKPAAVKRAALVSSWVARLRKCGHVEFIGDAVKDGAAATTAKDLADVEQAVRELEGKPCKIVPPSPKASNVPTFRKFAEQWTSGELHELYPDQIPIKDTAYEDTCRLGKHVYPTIGDKPLDKVTLDDALEVMRKVPSTLAAASRMQIAQLMRRVLQIATFPARHIEHNPIPKGFVQRRHAEPAKGCIYPDEETKLMACREVPLSHRVMYGFLHREGMRAGEGYRLRWGDMDLKRGAIRLDVNKTKHPRSWALDPGVVRALQAWKDKYRPKAKAGDLVFTDDGKTSLDHPHRAQIYREHLQAAGISRPELIDGSKTRRRVRFHDQRALFITTALANGKTETWVSDRTGHTTSQMINAYRRQAREWTELDMGTLLPLDEAIPELRPETKEGGETSNETSNSSPPQTTPKPHRSKKEPKSSDVHEGGVEPPRLSALEPKAHYHVASDLDTSQTSNKLDTVRDPSALNRPLFDAHLSIETSNATPQSAGEETPRNTLIRALAGSVARLAAAGDLGAARVASDALAALLREGSGEPAVVVDLADRRDRR